MKAGLLLVFIFSVFDSRSQHLKYSEAVIPKGMYSDARITGMFKDTLHVWNTGFNIPPTIYIYSKDLRLLKRIRIPAKEFEIYQLIHYKNFYYAFIYPFDKKKPVTIFKISASGNITAVLY